MSADPALDPALDPMPSAFTARTCTPYVSPMPNVLQMARGLVGTVTSRGAYAVRRLSPTLWTTILEAPPVLAAFPAKMVRTRKQDARTQTYELSLYTVVGDDRVLRPGDVLTAVSPDATNTRGTYVFAQRYEAERSVAVACDHVCYLTRERDTAALSVDVALPASGASLIDVGAYEETTDPGSSASTADVLVLVAGVYLLAPAANSPIPTTLPIAMQPTRAGADHAEALPTSAAEGRYTGYLPPTPGVTVLANDVLTVDGIGELRVLEAYDAGDDFAGVVMLLALVGA